MNFLSISKTVSFTHILFPIIRYAFKKSNKVWENLKSVDVQDQKNHLPHFSQKHFASKSKFFGGDFFLNACHQVRFQKSLMNWLGKKFKNIMLGPKMHHLPNFVHNKNFSKKGLSHIFVFFESNIMWKYQKKTNKHILFSKMS